MPIINKSLVFQQTLFKNNNLLNKPGVLTLHDC